MAMNVGSPDDGDESMNSTINTTPLVDVMLVLLIIFMITIPVVTQSVNLSLPKETNIIRVTKPENIELAVTKDGDIYWNTANVPNIDALKDRMRDIVKMDPQPEIHIRGDEGTRYESVGRVIFAAQQIGIVIPFGFLTIHSRRCRSAPAMGDKPVLRCVDADPVQPGVKGTVVAKTRQRPIGPDKTVLNNIFHLGRVTHHARN